MLPGTEVTLLSESQVDLDHSHIGKGLKKSTQSARHHFHEAKLFVHPDLFQYLSVFTHILEDHIPFICDECRTGTMAKLRQ